MALLEALLRGPVSAVDFAMLRRFKQIRGYRTDRQLFNAFRRARSALAELINNFDLPITLEWDGNHLRASFDSDQFATHILEAQTFADKAAACLSACDFPGAIRAAEKALEKDWDCAAAAELVFQVVPANPNSLKGQLITRAQLCYARSILVYEAAFQRLQGRYDPSLLQARIKAEESLILLQERFDLICSWSSLHSDEDHAGPVRKILEMWVNTCRNRLLGHGDFTSHPFIKQLAHQLLQKRRKKIASGKQREAGDLTPDIADNLYMSAWRPTPAMSLPELERQLLTFLGRRVGRQVGGGSACPAQQLAADESNALAHDNIPTAAAWMDVDNILEKKIPDEKKRRAFRKYLENVSYDPNCWPQIAQQYGISAREAPKLLKQLQDLLASMPEVQTILSRQRSRRSPGRR